MESLLHYVWQHGLFDASGLKTTDGLCVNVLYCGQHNVNQGPDFLNAKILIDGIVWVGNVEIHTCSSDWYRHGHNMDSVYNSTILHVVKTADVKVLMQNGRCVPQLEIEIPHNLGQRYQELLRVNDYPRCHNLVRDIPLIKVHSWMDSLLVRRMMDRTVRISSVFAQLHDNWNHTAFVVIARTLGFGLNGDPMEEWAKRLPFDDLYCRLSDLTSEYVEKVFLERAELTEGGVSGMWRYMRIRPQNFPEVRIKQLASVFHGRMCEMNKILECVDCAQLMDVFVDAGFSVTVSRLLIINAACPLIFTYGFICGSEEYRARALQILSDIKAENNFITRQWRECGIDASTAAESQALIQLKREYCERFRCLECRFGFEFLSQK